MLTKTDSNVKSCTKHRNKKLTKKTIKCLPDSNDIDDSFAQAP